MERTGASWTPVDNLREGTCPVLVVHAAQVKHGPGRTTDRADARWLANLRRYGVLPASVSPPRRSGMCGT
jgi:transposase